MGCPLTCKFCPSCGRQLDADTSICPGCDGRVVPLPARLNKANLLLLTAVLGGIGAHRFYLRQYLPASLYLLFSWTLLPSVAALVEFFLFLRRPEEALRAAHPEVRDEHVAFVVIFPLLGSMVVFAIAGIIAAILVPKFLIC
jgi:hypothetical protein